MTLADLKNKLEALKPEQHERFGESKNGVFGSWVRGKQKRAVKKILEDYNLDQ